MEVKNVSIVFEDNHYTADIELDNGFIVTEGKTFDELMNMIDDALKGVAQGKAYDVSRKMPAFTFNVRQDATQLQTN